MGCAQSVPLQPYPPFDTAAPDARLATSGPTNVALIVNPYSGGGKGAPTSELVREAMLKMGHTVEVLRTDRAGHAIELASGVAQQRRFGLVAVVGGDGTAHETVNGLAYGTLFGRAAGSEGARTHVPPVLLVPCGSGNTVAFNLGIRSYEDSLRALASGSVWFSDVLEITRPEDTGVPRLRAPPAGEMATGAPFAAVSAAAVGAAATATGAAPAPAAATATAAAGAAAPAPGVVADAESATALALSADRVKELGRRVVFSFNMTGWALSTAVMHTANDLRWLGGAQYNLAALKHVAANKSYIGSLQFIDPPEPVAVSADAYAAAREQLESALAEQKRGRSCGITTLVAPPAGAAAAAGVSASGVHVAVPVATATAPGVDSAAGSAPAASHAGGAGAAGAGDSTALVTGAGPAAVVTSAASAPGGSGGGAGSATPRLLPVPTPPVNGEACPYMMLQIQPASFMGSKMSFCPLSRMNDGLADICAIKHVSRAATVAIMDAAKLHGRHVLGKAGSAGPLPGVLYCQARELILRPLDARETREWLHGATVEPQFAGAAAAAVGSAAGAGATSAPAAAAPSETAPGPFPPLRIERPAGAEGVVDKRRAATHPMPQGMIGPDTLNVDGEVCGFTPARIRVLPRVLPLVCNPGFAPSSASA